jgi:hypothetical protein
MSDRVYQENENSTPFLSGYRELCIPILDAAGMPAWPEVFPIEKIEELRKTVGARHFSSQMMLEFVGAERARLDPGALHFYDAEFDARTAKLGDNLISGAAAFWDPSVGREKSDGSVVALVYRDDKNRRAFIHDVRYLRAGDDNPHPLATQCDAVLDFLTAHNMRRIGIEVNGIGNALPEIMAECARRRGAAVVVHRVINHRRKSDRILDALEPMLDTGRLFAHVRTRATPILSEMLGWAPMGINPRDDGLDALAGALQLPPVPVRPQNAKIQIIHAKTDFNF